LRRRDLLQWVPLTPLLSRLNWASSPTDPDGNVVDVYRAALSVLPELSSEESKLLREVTAARLDLSSVRLVRRCQIALNACEQEGPLSTCDWGNIWTGAGFKTITTWFNIRSLAGLILLRARLAFDAGMDRQGFEDIVRVMRMSRHFGRGGVIISQLFAFVIEHTAIEVAASVLPLSETPTSRRFASELGALPAPVSLAETVAAERAFFLGYVRPDEPEKYNKAVTARLLTFYNRLELALKQEDKLELEAIRNDRTLDPDLEGSFVSTIDDHRLLTMYIRVKRALHHAALAEISDGPLGSDSVADPSDELPFDMRRWATGFELTSRFAMEAKPLPALTIGEG
jgi:hypothetical protein